MSLFKKILSTSKSNRILILDPVEAAVYNNKSKFGVEKFTYQDVESALLDLYKALSEVSGGILDSISQITVINPGDKESGFTEERQRDFFDKLSNFDQSIGRPSKVFLELFKNCVFLNYTNDIERVKLLDFTRHKEILFFDFTLTRAVINHLHTELQNHNIFGYSRLGNDNLWKEIEDVQKYISIAYVLTVETVASSNEEERLRRAQSMVEEYFEKLLSTIKLNTSGKFFIIMGKESIPDFSTLRKSLDSLGESFHFIECPPESLKQLPDQRRVFIRNVQKLPSHKLFDLCSLVLNKDNKDKLIILHSSQNISLIDFPEFNIFPIYSLKQADEIFQNYLGMQEYNQNIVQNLANDLELWIKGTIKNQSVLKQKLKELEKLKATERFADFKKFNYWYQYDSLHFPSMEYRIKFLLEESAKYFSDIDSVTSIPQGIDSDWIKFEHKNNKADWVIFNKKGKRFPSQPYNGSKGIKYMAMLVKRYEYPSDIPIEILIKKINSWNEDDIKYRTQSDHLVKMFIRTDLKKIDNQLLYLYKDFKIKDICYYQPETDLKILIDDDDFPT